MDNLQQNEHEITGSFQDQKSFKPIQSAWDIPDPLELILKNSPESEKSHSTLTTEKTMESTECAKVQNLIKQNEPINRITESVLELEINNLCNQDKKKIILSRQTQAIFQGLSLHVSHEKHSCAVNDAIKCATAFALREGCYESSESENHSKSDISLFITALCRWVDCLCVIERVSRDLARADGSSGNSSNQRKSNRKKHVRFCDFNTTSIGMPRLGVASLFLYSRYVLCILLFK